MTEPNKQQKFIKSRNTNGETKKLPCQDMQDRISPTAIQTHITAKPSAIQKVIMNIQ